MIKLFGRANKSVSTKIYLYWNYFVNHKISDGHLIKTDISVHHFPLFRINQHILDGIWKPAMKGASGRSDD